MSRRKKMHWGLFEKGNKLYVELNGKHNRTLNMLHEDYPKYLQELKDEIDFLSTFSNVKVVAGSEYLENLS